MRLTWFLWSTIAQRKYWISTRWEKNGFNIGGLTDLKRLVSAWQYIWHRWESCQLRNLCSLKDTFYHKFSHAQKNRTFAASQHSVTLRSLLPFAARCTNVRLEAKLWSSWFQEANSKLCVPNNVRTKLRQHSVSNTALAYTVFNTAIQP